MKDRVLNALRARGYDPLDLTYMGYGKIKLDIVDTNEDKFYKNCVLFTFVPKKGWGDIESTALIRPDKSYSLDNVPGCRGNADLEHLIVEISRYLWIEDMPIEIQLTSNAAIISVDGKRSATPLIDMDKYFECYLLEDLVDFLPESAPIWSLLMLKKRVVEEIMAESNRNR